MFGGLGIGEIAIIAFVLVVLFSGNKLPALGAGIGKAIKNFKKETKNSEA